MSLSKRIQPKRGYLANILTIPPLIYPFQYNPQNLSDTKSLDLETRDPIITEARGVEGLIGSVKGGYKTRSLGAVTRASPEIMGRTFSGAKMKTPKEGDRKLNFKFFIDGLEKRPGEPERRRKDGTILADIAILRSFVYPYVGDLFNILKTAYGNDENRWMRAWFNSPPTVILIMGDMSVEGFITDLKINETMFNDDLDPVRAEIEISMIEKIDSLSFIIDSVKRLGRTFYYTAYEDIGDVII